MKVTRFVSAAAATMLVLTLVACGGSASSFAQESLDDVSGIRVEAENAGSDQEALSESAIKVEEGDAIIISPFVDKGSFHLTITSDSDGEVIYDDDVDGKVMFMLGAEPGTYTVETSGNDVTGWMTVFAQNQDDLAAQNEELEDAIGAAEDEVVASEEGVSVTSD